MPNTEITFKITFKVFMDSNRCIFYLDKNSKEKKNFQQFNDF